MKSHHQTNQMESEMQKFKIGDQVKANPNFYSDIVFRIIEYDKNFDTYTIQNPISFKTYYDVFEEDLKKIQFDINNNNNKQQKENTQKKFWYVFNPNGGAPRLQHKTLESAQAEAKRLSELNPQNEFLVLEAVSSHKAVVKEEDTQMKNNNQNVQITGRIGFFGLLTILFIALKLTGYITWSWWWVLSPIWIPWLIILVILAIAALFSTK